MRTLTIITAALALAGAAALSGYALASDPLPTCASEDSPACVWVDPDTGTTYVNGSDAGLSIEERTGIPWCDARRTNAPCLEVVP